LRAEDGATLFAERCAACHGQDGHAKTPAGRKVGAKDLAQSVLSDPAIEHQIAEGAKDSAGRAKMPPFKDQLSPDDIKALVSYVKSFREPRTSALGQFRRGHGRRSPHLQFADSASVGAGSRIICTRAGKNCCKGN
jgi:cytochrome c6